MSPAYTVRLAGPADLQALVGLGMADHEYHRLVQPDLPRVELAKKRERYQAVMGADNGVVLVAASRDTDVPVGMVVAFVETRRAGRPVVAYVEEAYVGRSHRRQGLLRAMMAALATWAAGQGVERIELEYFAGNEAGEAAWRALGFEPRSVRAAAPVASLRGSS